MNGDAKVVKKGGNAWFREHFRFLERPDSQSVSPPFGPVNSVIFARGISAPGKVVFSCQANCPCECFCSSESNR